LYSIGTFFSGLTIAYVRGWKLALILSSTIPALVIIIGGGGKMVATASKRAMAGYAAAATISEEVLSSVRTAQAFGTEDKLAATYDEKLAAAQKAGYRKSFALALLMASIMCIRYLLFGLGFCNSSTFRG
jgi:ATP-binding cassette, subfamily B (MDR/TAP), member 1